MNNFSTHKIKLLVIVIIFLLSVFSMYSCMSYETGGDKYGYLEDTMPWIVFNASDCSSVSINWITEGMTDTRVLFGKSGDVPTLIEAEGGRVKQHHLTISGIEAGCIYSYGPVFPGMSPEDVPLYEFRAPPKKGGEARILIVGDMQPKNESTVLGCSMIADAVKAESPDLVIQLGDLSQIGGFFSSWKLSLAAVSAYSATAPIQAIAGNHDQYADGGGNFRRLFPYDYASHSGLYYSFDYGSAHFIMINAFDSWGNKVSAAQKAWAEEDVDTARRNGAEWVFIVIHDTVLSSGTMGSNEELMSWLIPMADRNDIDAVLFGHDHHYEHWLVEYGSDGLLLSPDKPSSGNAVHYFCAGGGGTTLETGYGLLDKEYKPYEITMYRAGSGDDVIITVTQRPWDSSDYIDYSGKSGYGRDEDSRHYYQLPGKSYRSDCEQFGYEYGEQTLQYMMLEMEGEQLKISVHYPNGELLSGPNGGHPQEFSLSQGAE